MGETSKNKAIEQTNEASALNGMLDRLLEYVEDKESSIERLTKTHLKSDNLQGNLDCLRDIRGEIGRQRKRINEPV